MDNVSILALILKIHVEEMLSVKSSTIQLFVVVLQGGLETPILNAINMSVAKMMSVPSIKLAKMRNVLILA